MDCEMFQENQDSASMAQTLKIIAREYKAFKGLAEQREKEIHNISMEMALGLSEVFEALQRISKGDPQVRIPERSSLELILKLKQLVNLTAENLGEIVDLSHEFAIGLAEHFDVLHRMAAGDLSARVTGTSDVELLESLKNVTNQMIESVAREISERKEAQERLGESEERFRTFAEKAPIGITIMRPDQQFEYINPTFTEIFGYTIREIPDKRNWFEKAYPEEEYREAIVARWNVYGEQQHKIGIPHPSINMVRCKDGQDKTINIRTVVLKDGKHFTTYADITDRANAEEAIKHSEEKYRTLIENIQDGVFILQDGKMQFANEALASISGYPVDEIVGFGYEKLVAPEDLETVTSRYLRRIAGEEVEQEYELVLLHKDGHSRVNANMTVGTFRYLGRLAILGTVKDITQQRKADKEKMKLEAQLQRSQKMEAIGTLAGGVAHDLNNILSGIVSYPELLLLDLPADSPLKNPILTIKRSGEKAAAIVQDLLTLARRGVAVTDIVDLNRVITDYLQTPEFENLQRYHRNVTVETDLAPGLLHIMGSVVHLSKTIMNLLSNAAEAMPDGGKVVLKTENRYVDRPVRGYDEVMEGDYVTLTVEDSGIGISAEDMNRIFEPFYTKKIMGRSGTGLGMAVVWGTVKDHNGYIDARSHKGKGTTFVLYFPVSRKRVRSHLPEASITDYTGAGESILVVDDVREQREIASEILSRLGYSVRTISSGEEAVAAVKEQPVDLIVLDMIMEPGIDGYETYRQILEISPGQRVIIASGFSETDRVKMARDLGARIYLKKPYTIEKLGRAVQSELGRR